jgi:hypothetical protein
LAAGSGASSRRRGCADRRNHHLFQPLLYQVATTLVFRWRRRTSRIGGAISPSERISVLGDVVGVDLNARRVTVDTMGLRTEVGCRARRRRNGRVDDERRASRANTFSLRGSRRPAAECR